MERRNEMYILRKVGHPLPNTLSHHHARDPIEGEGIVRDVYHFFTGNWPGEKKIKELIEKHGDSVIEKMYVVRVPLKSIHTILADMVSDGKFTKAVKKTPYDKLFHLSLNISLSDGYSFAFEKNKKVEVNPPIDTAGQEYRNVPVNKEIKLRDFITNGIKTMTPRAFYDYDAFKNNCQDFIIALLQANGLLNGELRSFIKQDVSSIAKESGPVPGLMKVGTELVGTLF